MSNEMKILYLDCFSGISGDMTLGAFVDLGVEENYLISELQKLGDLGFEIKIGRAIKNGIDACNVEVILNENEDDHDYEHEHHHEHDHEHYHDHDDHEHEHHHDHAHEHSHIHRNLGDVTKIIEESTISDSAKEIAKKIFEKVAVAEAKVHNKPLSEVHFHEVGALDSIVDIVGAAICIDYIKPDKICASVLNDGHGFINCQHGLIPVPVPAVVEILSRDGVPSKQIDVDTELVTPTGAAIAAYAAETFGAMPNMTVLKTGYGAGKKDLKIPNVLRLILGEASNETEDVTVLECNIDDCSPEILGFVMDELFDNGARDVFFTGIQMKKNRHATMLTVICDDETLASMEEIIFKQTSTIGIRRRHERRHCLQRELKKVMTSFGEAEVKKVKLKDGFRYYPEYESAKKLAKQKDVSLKEVYDCIARAVEED